jgi:hypothetical protein
MGAPIRRLVRTTPIPRRLRFCAVMTSEYATKSYCPRPLKKLTCSRCLSFFLTGHCQTFRNF